ncbi:MAG: hypothetical protein ACRD0W_24730 [Acidimicrobiales bacterium]
MGAWLLFFAILPIAAFLAGAIIRSWWAVLAPVVLVTAFYVGLLSGWWGYGVGDGWEYVAIFLALGAMAITAATVVISRLLVKHR